jgi:iron complex outermembrane receptor protein
MHASLRFSVFLATAGFAAAQTQDSPAGDPALHLDRLVVSAGIDDKTAFDLAQGTSILAGADLRRRLQGTLGDALDATPGVNSTYYGPGASRPIIRGLGGDRVRVLQSGVGALDASNISPDHNTAIEPLFARRIEVLRGPATLLYGGSALGGVVNVDDNRIPDRPFERAISGTIEARGFGSAEETTGLAAIGAGTERFALQVDALRRHAGDTRIPGVARIDDEAPALQPAGILPNSDIDTQDLSVGATWFGDAGHFGAAVSGYDTDYGVPVDEPISISMRQRRLDLHGELTEPFGLFRSARAQFGFADYTHREIAERVTTNTTFKNKSWEGRLELPHRWHATLSGTLGAQASCSDFSALGEEVAAPPSVTRTEAVFLLEEWKRLPVTVQLGARVERQSIRLGDVPDGLPVVDGYAAHSGEHRDGTQASGSAGVVFYPAQDWSTALSLSYSERMPTTQELFSNGPHGGTGAWEIGHADLTAEKAVGLDFSVRKRAGFVTGAVSAFANRFDGYIFEQQLAAGTIPEELNEEGLTPYQFTAKDAEFYGAEAELAFHLIERENYAVHLQLTSDYVHAQQTSDDQPLPRIPPWRMSAALRYDGGRLHGGIELRRAMAQNRIAATETATPGYTLLNADLSYIAWTEGPASCELFVRGTNLTNEEARAHTSFLKNFAPLPGRGVLVGLRARF